MVNCPFCDSVVTRGERVLTRAEFHECWKRVHEGLAGGTHQLKVGRIRFDILTQLGAGETSEVFLARRMDPLPERVVLKLARDGAPTRRLVQEHDNIKALQALQGSGSAYFSQRLPQAALLGRCAATGRDVLALRNNPGFWGSLADVSRHNPSGIEPRHAVWMWRRVLDILGYVHAQGWTHSDLHPGHLLVHPADHGILVTGWRKARQEASRESVGQDLSQAAWSIRALLHGYLPELSDGATATFPGTGSRTPPYLAALVRRASEDPDWCARMGATGIDVELKSAALQDFGPPRFFPFDPLPSSRPSR